MAGLFNSGVGQVLTLDDIFSQLSAQVTDGTILEPFRGPAESFAKRMMGLEGPGYRDVLLDTVMFSSMSDYGTAHDLMERRIQRVARDYNKSAQIAAKKSFFTKLAKTRMSYSSWAAQQRAAGVDIADINEDAYNTFMENEGAGDAANPIGSFLYNMFDFEGAIAASQNLEQAGANMIRKGRYAGRREAFLHARAVGNLFINEKTGKFDFDKKDYGSMNIGEASAITAALTADIDFFSGAEDIKAATERLRTKTKEYAQALSPLKDVFGTDVPAMIKAVEDMTGRKLSQLDSTSLKQMTQEAIAGTIVGNYQLGQVVETGNRIRSAMTQLPVSYMNDLSSKAQAELMLGITNAGILPSTMSRERYNQMVADRVLRTNNSGGAEALNQAYALWLDKNANGTFKEFSDQYRAKIIGGLDANKAIMAMAGVEDFYTLEQRAKRSYNLSRAMEENAGELAMYSSTEKMIQTYQKMANAQGNGVAFAGAIEAIRADASILSDTKKLQGLKGVSDDAKAEVLAIAQGAYGDLGNVLLMQDSADKQREARRQQVRAMKRAETFKGILENDLTGLFRAVIDEGGDIKKFIEGQSQYELGEVTDSDLELLKESAVIANTLSNQIDGDPHQRQTAREQFMRDLVLNGPANGIVTELSQKLGKAIKSGDSSGGSTLIGRVGIALHADESMLNAYLTRYGTSDEDKEAQWRLLERRYSDLIKTGAIDAIGTEINDITRAEKFYGILEGSRKFESVLEPIKTELGSLLENAGEVSKDDYKSVVTRVAKNAKLDETQTSELMAAVNELFGEDTTSPQTIYTDLMSTMNGLCSHIESLVSVIEAQNTDNSYKDGPVGQAVNKVGGYVTDWYFRPWRYLDRAIKLFSGSGGN